MYLTRMVCLGAFGIMSAWGASGENVIYHWGNAPEDAYTINQDLATITIHTGGGYSFRFYARSGADPGDINNITVDADATGDFELHIRHPAPDPTPAVENLGEMNLRYNGGESTVWRIWCSGDLAWLGNAVLDKVDGTIEVGGDLGTASPSNYGLSCVRWSSSYPGTPGDDLIVHGDLLGNVTIGEPGQTEGYGGDIWVQQELKGKLIIIGHLWRSWQDQRGSIRVGNLTGEILITDDVPEADGTNFIRIESMNGGKFSCDDFRMGILDDVGGLVVEGDLSGEIDIRGELSGVVQLEGHLSTSGSIAVAEDVAGKIRIDGSLKDNPEVDYEIEVTGTITSTGAVTVDYDGWDRNDNWKDGAIVRVDGQNYSANYPSLHIWEVSECKADLTNDWLVDSTDGYFFGLAQNETWYNAQFPGLEGSRVWHGDTNCDGLYDGDDYPTFMAWVTSGVCAPVCSLPPPPLRAPPAETAELLLRMLPADQGFDLLEAVGRAANDEDDPEAAEYWWDVLDILLQ